MSRAPLAVALVAALVVAVAGCAPATESSSAGVSNTGADIDVDTPQLRTIKESAEIAACEPGDASQVEGGMPNVTLPCLGGGPDVNVAGLRGPMVVNLWAVWCTPCRKELPILQRFHEKYGDRVPVLGIDYNDTQPEQALELARRSGVTYPLHADPQTELDHRTPLPSLRGLPFLALVDEDGQVVHQEFVELESKDQLVGLVNEHLGTHL
jgi:thiol-disulfide isomerase/thioredoxin